ncbi:MAG: hypothetical protein WBX15_20720 [Thermoanaerobaculia bacterium]
MSSDPAITVKASPVKSLIQFVDSELSPGEKEAALASLPPQYAERIRSHLLASDVVPVDLVNRLTEAAAAAKHESVDTFAYRAGRAAAMDATRIYRFLLIVTSPLTLLSKSASVWKTLYNRGDLRVEEKRDGFARLRLHDFPSEPSGCARTTGWIERLAELTGAKAVRVEQTRCHAREGGDCEWEIHWS